MRVVRVVAAAAAALLIAGCGGSGDSDGDKDPKDTKRPTNPSGAQGGDQPALPAALTGQKLDWGRCEADSSGQAPGSEWQCATLQVPRDYAKPDGERIGIALIRAESTGEGDRLGSLLFNFGGPGGSGISGLPSLSDLYGKLRGRYDLVSFDPRGVAASEGLRCRDDEKVAAAETIDLSPDDAKEEKTFLADAADFAKGCDRDAGELLPHLSTQATAHDMDLMRQVLGDDKMHYFGISYGTQLGGTYAHLFPGRVGRVVLDAVVDPSAGAVGHAKNQALGFQRALEDYLRSTGEDPKKGTARIVRLLDGLDAKPMPAGGGRELTQTLAQTGIAVTLYSKDNWPALTAGLEAAEDGDGSELLRLADAYNGRDEAGSYDTQSHSQRAISCRDAKERPTAAEAKRELAEFRRLSPVFGEFLGWDTAGWCHGWTVPGLEDTPEVSAPGAAPVLVVGNTGDPATPYEGTRRMADELGKDVGVMLTWKGEGHGAYGSGSDCVDGTVDDYLLKGEVPKDGKVCD
ncbi:alpha/beta hydrolase [Streptomyces sp. NA04227]|uniref:alpha/beta hydrolase n=1 Tax=Streptomyces sp. NA04227 TaxID=2742136 RepID=UPI0020CA7130|nr:alpha/beta hydrolase [Streptomyces sp. NA04227]